MSNRLVKISLLLCVLVGVIAYDASAWGPRAQRAIGGTAIQVIRRSYANAFRTDDRNYEEDVLRGALAGPEIMKNGKPFAREEDALVAIENELRLLREVRKYGFGSYFSYRMGVLGSLVANLLLPYALDSSPQNQALRERMESDIDARLDQFSFTTTRAERRYVRDVHKYFEQCRPFYADSKRMIGDDYQRGKGYDGYLREGASAFFGRAVEAVADTWHTILRVEGDPSDVPPSQDTVTWYLVAEIRYLLFEKKNLYQATQTYQTFEKVAAVMPAAYEKVGDLFYQYGTDEGLQRGVREWRIAYEMQGADRRDIGKKLSAHYIKVGEALLATARRPGASDQDLPNALNAFTQALGFDQTSDVAAARINDTNVAISERKGHRELNINIIASAEKVMVQAEKARLGGDYGNAITTYNQALGLFQAIDEEFTDQSSTAKESVKEINKNITDIINEVLDAASDLIDKGDKAVDEHKFEEAVGIYEQVPAKVAVIPGDESTTHGKEKADVIGLSKKKIDDAKLAKSRWEETERQRKAAAEAAAKAAGR